MTMKYCTQAGEALSQQEPSIQMGRQVAVGELYDFIANLLPRYL